jgi:hypothetical protein
MLRKMLLWMQAEVHSYYKRHFSLCFRLLIIKLYLAKIGTRRNGCLVVRGTAKIRVRKPQHRRRAQRTQKVRCASVHFTLIAPATCDLGRARTLAYG